MDRKLIFAHRVQQRDVEDRRAARLAVDLGDAADHQATCLKTKPRYIVPFFLVIEIRSFAKIGSGRTHYTYLLLLAQHLEGLVYRLRRDGEAVRRRIDVLQVNDQLQETDL
eukprot:COSAG06_NODE_8013_length_2301_cov_7.319709_3_plen_111_part_00